MKAKLRYPSPDKVRQMDLAELRELVLADFDRDITPDEIRHILEICDALWLHSGDSLAPHAELTSGMCSDGFADVLRMLRYSNLCEIMAGQLVRVLRQHYDGKVDWVIGSDHAGAVLSHDVARLLKAQHDFTEKSEGKKQVWRRFQIKPDEVVLQVEELITTTGTLQAVREGLRAGNLTPVNFVPFTLALVHRSDSFDFEGDQILHLAHYDINKWSPADCPLCKSGSGRLRPKDHWAELKGGSGTSQQAAHQHHEQQGDDGP